MKLSKEKIRLKSKKSKEIICQKTEKSKEITKTNWFKMGKPIGGIFAEEKKQRRLPQHICAGGLWDGKGKKYRTIKRAVAREGLEGLGLLG